MNLRPISTKGTATSVHLEDGHDDFTDLFEEAPIPYVHEAMDSRFIRANRAARSLLGVEPAEVTSTFGRSLITDR